MKIAFRHGLYPVGGGSMTYPARPCRTPVRQGRKPGVAWWKEGGREGVARVLLFVCYLFPICMLFVHKYKSNSK